MALSNLFGIGTFINNTLHGNDNRDIQDIRSYMKEYRSISAKAKKAVATYPVYFSSTFGDYDELLNISKFLEIQFAIFTLIDMGLDPVLKENENVESKLSILGTEEYKEAIRDNTLDFNLVSNESISIDITNDRELGMARLKESFNFGKSFGEDTFRKWFSLEDVGEVDDVDDGRDDRRNNRRGIRRDDDDDRPRGHGLSKIESAEIAGLEKKLSLGHPTILTFAYKQGEGVGENFEIFHGSKSQSSHYKYRRHEINFFKFRR